MEDFKSEKLQDRVIVLKPMEGKDVLSSKGVIDNRIFSGENKLHAILDPKNTLWSFRLDHGGLPEPLKGRFTNFEKALAHAIEYFKKRNIAFVRVED